MKDFNKLAMRMTGKFLQAVVPFSLLSLLVLLLAAGVSSIYSCVKSEDINVKNVGKCYKEKEIKSTDTIEDWEVAPEPKPPTMIRILKVGEKSYMVYELTFVEYVNSDKTAAKYNSAVKKYSPEHVHGTMGGTMVEIECPEVLK